MFKKLCLTACALALCAAPAAADHHEGPPPPPPGPHIMIPLPPDTHLPPPEDGPEAFVEAAIAALDEDGDGRLSRDEILAAMRAMHEHMEGGMHGGEPGGMHGGEPGGMHGGDHGGMPPEGEMGGPSEGEEGLAGLPYPPECSEEVRNSELLPQEEGVTCGDHTGNLIFRTVCNVAPYNSNAISLPAGRAADCFSIEAIKGHNLVFEIVNEDDGTVVFDTSMGKDAFMHLVLVGDMDGTVYRINLLSADEADARMTIRFLDHPTDGGGGMGDGSP